jgi:hypothetical protein
MLRTYNLDGFLDTVALLEKHARAGRLVSCSINLDPRGFGHFSWKLLDGQAMPGMAELAGESHDDTPSTAPGKGQR